MRLKRWRHPFVTAPIFLALLTGPLRSQTPEPSSNDFTLENAVAYALKHYPGVRAAEERTVAAQGEVGLAKTNYLPRADTLWQVNRATRNNIFGLLLPQSVIPAISGPVLPSTSNSSVWGSAAGLLLSWEPFDLGYRRATVDAAHAAQNRAEAEAEAVRLDVAVSAVSAFMDLVAAHKSVEAAQADLRRRQVFADSIHVLVANELRPGADASRADAELAKARIGLIRAEQQEQIGQAALAEILGLAGTKVKIEPGSLLTSPPDTSLAPVSLANHPLAKAEKDKVIESQARLHALDRFYVPKFSLQSAVSGRGTGADVNGTTAGGLNGLGVERANWAVGFSVSFPVMDFFSIRARKQITSSNERAESAHYDEILQALTGRRERARAALEGARRVAENTPIQLKAARNTENQARARYQAGLGTVVEVSDAQGLLAQAETDDALARLAVWHNLAILAASEGDLEPFMQLLRKNTLGGL